MESVQIVNFSLKLNFIVFIHKWNSIFALMKWAAKILIFVFVIFLSTPTIVSVIKKNMDMSCFYSMSEEELTHKEVKAEFKFDPDLMAFIVPSQMSGLILSENLSRHDNIASTIFIPPPELS